MLGGRVNYDGVRMIFDFHGIEGQHRIELLGKLNVFIELALDKMKED